jgi:hypothetical protein
LAGKSIARFFLGLLIVTREEMVSLHQIKVPHATTECTFCKVSPVTSKFTTRGRIKGYHPGALVFSALWIAFGKDWSWVFSGGMQR